MTYSVFFDSGTAVASQLAFNLVLPALKPAICCRPTHPLIDLLVVPVTSNYHVR